MRNSTLLRIIAFLVVLIVADRLAGLALGRLASGVAVSGGSPRYFDRALATPDCDTIVLGSSQAVHGLDPAVIGAITGRGCLNLGCHGQGIYSYLLVLALIEEGRLKPATVVVCGTYDDLFTERSERVLRFGRLAERSREVRDALVAKDALLSLKWLSASYPFNAVNPAALLQERWRGGEARRDDGFVPLIQTKGPGPTRRADILPLGGLRPAKLELYAVLLERLRAKGIRTVLAVLPSHHPDFAVPQEDEALLRWQALAADRGVPCVALTADRHAEFSDPTLFADAFHLNPQGAAAASRLLAQHLAEH
jgi:hypothetical protein